MNQKKPVLGRGLGALIDDASNKSTTLNLINEIDLDKIQVNPFQPRKDFDEELLNELAESIKNIGLIQPLTLRKVDEDNFQLIAGERRFRAAKIAGLTKVPAYIRTTDDHGMLEMALIENIQREDLNPIEIAISYQQLIEDFNITQEKLSERVGKKRSTVANYIRLLNLPAEVQLGLRNRKISMGHARALVGIENPETQLNLYHQILKNEFSVRDIEDAVRKINPEVNTENKQARKESFQPEEYNQLKNQLSSYFGSEVDFKRNAKGVGKIVIPFNSDEDLERIIAALDKINS